MAKKRQHPKDNIQYRSIIPYMLLKYQDFKESKVKNVCALHYEEILSEVLSALFKNVEQ